MQHTSSPRMASGWLPRLRHSLFSTPLNTTLTLLTLVLLIMALRPLIQWLFVDAYWSGDTPAACVDRRRACWPFISAHWDLFIYGLYPQDERWRIILGFGTGVALWLAARRFQNVMCRRAALITLLTVYPPGLAALLLGGWFGLARVPTHLWGGFFLTVVVVSFVFYASFVFGILLALGRQSSLRLVRALTAAWIEFWRAVPALVLLFVAIILFPLFVPAGVEIDKLLRALIAFTLILSTFIAEAMRGALQSLPAGQHEAAGALGMSRWQSHYFVILPQAVSIAMPQMTSNFIGLLKETTVLLIIGLHDLFGMVQSLAADRRWMGPGVIATGYLFTALFYWSICFSVSRYAARLEKRQQLRAR